MFLGSETGLGDSKVLQYKRKAKLEQKGHHDKGARVLKPLLPGDTVKMHDGRGWNVEATLLKSVAFRSYDVVTPECNLQEKQKTFTPCAATKNRAGIRNCEISL